MEELAFRLFLQGKELFWHRELRETIRNILEERSYLEKELAGNTRELIEELEGDGLLIKAGEGRNPPYLFLHLTFQEYLTACALARRTRPKLLDREEVPEWLAIVKPHFFDPRWEQVILMLATAMKNATPLVKVVWHEKEDVLFRRLLLTIKIISQVTFLDLNVMDKVLKTLFSILEGNVPQGEASQLEAIKHDEEFKRALCTLATVNEQVFLRVFALAISSKLDRGRAGFLINALGLSQTKATVSQLVHLLNHPSAIIREHAAAALANHEGEKVISVLATCLKDNIPNVRWAAAWALGVIQDQIAVPELANSLDDPDFHVRVEAALALGRIGGRDAIDKLMQRVGDPHYHVRTEVAIALGQNSAKEAASRLLKMMTDGVGPAGPAAWALVQILGRDNVVPQLIRLLQSSNPGIKEEAAYAVGYVHAEEAAPYLLDILIKNCPEPPEVISTKRISPTTQFSVIKGARLELLKPYIELTMAALWALGMVGWERSIPYIMPLLSYPVPEVRMAAVDALGKIGAKKPLALLTPTVCHYSDRATSIIKPFYELLMSLEDSDLQVRGIAARALGAIGSVEAIRPLLTLIRQPGSPWYTRVRTFWYLHRLRKRNQYVVSFIKDLEQKESNKREALLALRSVSRKQGIRIFLDGTWVKVGEENRFA